MCYFYNLQSSFSYNFNSSRVSYRTWHDSSTMNTAVEESCQLRKKDYLDLNNRAGECLKIVPATVEESCKRIQKHKMDVRYNVHIAAVLYFQITYYVQHQFHKVFPSVLTKAGRGFQGPY